jgi:hypothetical protein
MDSSHGKLTQIMDGIYKLDVNTDRPDELDIDGVIYSRFMDVFYLAESTQDLDESKVIALCREREKLNSYGPANDAVKKVFASFITTLGGTNILEIGAGKEPTLTQSTFEGIYVLADTDPEVIKHNKLNARESTRFSSTVSLKYPSVFFDVAFAVFVFHFKIYDSQFVELRRCIKDDGIFLVNVYLLNDKERIDLSQTIRKHDFELLRIPDPIKVCRNHEYWIFSLKAKSLILAEKVLKDILNSRAAEQL